MKWQLILAIGILAVLVACSKAECKANSDCLKPHFSGSCDSGKCSFTPKANECGNSLCDSNENECSCADDCGTCSGSVAGSKYLTQSCDSQQNCATDMKTAGKETSRTDETSSSGDRFRVITTYNSPFNLGKDSLKLQIGLASQSASNSKETIKRIEVTATTPDKRTVTIAQKDLSKTIWSTGGEYDIIEELPLDVTGSELEGSLIDPTIAVTYSYDVKSSSSVISKTSTFKIKLSRTTIEWARPDATYTCGSCDDDNSGTQDSCDNGRCVHTPINDACGNYVCDGGENECTCAKDCGPCAGGTEYTEKSCSASKCITTLKSGTKQSAENVFYPVDTGAFALNANYKYNSPFNTASDSFTIDLELTSAKEGVSNIQINTIRVLDGSQELAISNDAMPLTEGTTTTAIVRITGMTGQEEHPTTITAWYSYDKDGTTLKNTFSKGLGRITYITPDA